MKTITKEELAKKIELHRKWLNDEEGGERLELVGYNLRGSDLSDSDLSRSDLRGSNLSGSNLSGSNLSRSDLSRSNLSGSDLRRSNLSGCNLGGCNLGGSDLRGSNLIGSDLRGSNLIGSDLDYSCLPLWCGSLGAYFDDRQIIQIVYHAVKAGLDSPNVSEGVKTELRKVAGLANRFHRVDECGRIEAEE